MTRLPLQADETKDSIVDLFLTKDLIEKQTAFDRLILSDVKEYTADRVRTCSVEGGILAVAVVNYEVQNHLYFVVTLFLRAQEILVVGHITLRNYQTNSPIAEDI